jgi:hypothetical protein
MAPPERSERSQPVWRRGEAALSWQEAKDPASAGTPAGSGIDAPAVSDRHESMPQAPDRDGPGEGARDGDRHGDEADPSAQRAAPDWRNLPEGDDASTDAEHPPRQLHPLPRGLVELYGLLAVLFVLVPEWMASGALFGFREGRQGSELPPPSGAWKRLPELRLASLNLAELRQLAREQRVIGYSRQNRQDLTAHLLRRLKASP